MVLTSIIMIWNYRLHFKVEIFFSLKPLLPNMLVDGGESLEGYRYYRWALPGTLKEQVMFGSSVELRSHLTWLPIIPRRTLTRSFSDFSQKSAAFYD